MRILTSSLFAESYLLYWTAFVLYLQAFWNKRETGSLIKQRTAESKKKDTCLLTKHWKMPTNRLGYFKVMWLLKIEQFPTKSLLKARESAAEKILFKW